MNNSMNDAYTAEQSVIGGLMIIGDLSEGVCSKIFAMLKPASFKTPEHQQAYAAILKLADRNEYVDLISMELQIKRDGYYTEGTLSYLAEMWKNTPSAANIMAYAHIVRQESIKRVAMSKLNEAIATIGDHTAGDIYQRLGLVESLIGDVLNRSMNNQTSGLRHVKEIADKWTEDWMIREENPDAMKGFSSGFEELDNLLGPKLYVPGSLVVVGARPKMGKTAFLNATYCHFGLNAELTSVMFSLEMPSNQLFERMLAEQSRVNPKFFYTTAADQCLTNDYDSTMARVSGNIGRFLNSEMYIDDTPGITIDHIKRESRKLAKTKKIGIIAVDYLTLMKAGKADRNDLAYGEITKELKNLAKELDCVVLLLTQLSRGLESRADKRPMPSDSRDTGQIEQDCDVWIGLYRESVYNENVSTEDKGATEVLVRLNRHGETGKFMLDLRNGYFVPRERQSITINGKSKSECDY